VHARIRNATNAANTSSSVQVIGELFFEIKVIGELFFEIKIGELLATCLHQKRFHYYKTRHLYRAECVFSTGHLPITSWPILIATLVSMGP
jgi:hypothetical protein